MKKWAGILVALSAGLFFKLSLDNLPDWMKILCIITSVPFVFWGLYLIFNRTTIEEDLKPKKDK